MNAVDVDFAVFVLEMTTAARAFFEPALRLLPENAGFYRQVLQMVERLEQRVQN